MNSVAIQAERPPRRLVPFGFAVLLLYMYVALSRVLDFTVPNVRIPLVLFALMVCTALLSRARFSGPSSIIGVCLLLHIGWMALAVPFSVWRGGSVEILLQVVKNFVLFTAIASLTVTMRQCRQLCVTTALAILTVALLSVPFGDRDSGRLHLSSGSLTDPNEYAMLLLIGFTMWLWMARDRSAGWIRRTASVAAIGILGLTFAQTGSRAGFVTLLVVAAVLLGRASLTGKIGLVVLAAAVTAISGMILSDYVSQRFVTFFQVDRSAATDADTATRLSGSAVASTDSRIALLQESLRVTWAHPLVGAGPNQFPVYSDLQARARGLRRGSWLLTHNSYTQISSECGIPALLFYVAAIFYCFRATSMRRHQGVASGPAFDEVRHFALHLRLVLLTIVVFSLFLSLAYSAYFYIVAGMVAAFHRSASSLQQIATDTRAAEGEALMARRRFAWTGHPRLATRRQHP